MKAIPYLTFNGNCEEAMLFYQKCLGGDLFLQRLGDTDFSEPWPNQMGNCIVHATLKHRNLVLFGSDLMGDGGLVRGNSFTIMLILESERSVRLAYNALSEGGEQTCQLLKTHWNGLLGGITDKYGVHWLLHTETKV